MDSVNDTLSILYKHVEIGFTTARGAIPGGTLGIAALLAVAYISIKYAHSSIKLSRTKKKIAARQAKAEATKTRLEQRLEKCKIDSGITELPFQLLQEKLRRGELKPTQVLHAYQAKALKVTREINCVTDFIENAEERAIFLDNLDATKRGPLHGIPFSVKDAVGIKGYDSTTGLANFIGHEFADDSALVKVLVSQGAIPFAKTNISQGQMSVDCANPLFGVTANPHNHKRTCGGSSGGEAALIGARASPMGVGCDMGGSIRIPCHFCGVVGLKPTPHRLSGHGNFEFGRFLLNMHEVYGTLGGDVTSCVQLFKGMLGSKLYEYDPLIPCLPWREELYTSKKPLTVGFYISDGGMEPTPSVKRCVLEAKKALESRGHKVIEVPPPKTTRASQLFFQALLADDGVTTKGLLKDDVLHKPLQELLILISLPRKIRVLLSYILPGLSPVEKEMLTFKSPGSVANLWKLNEQLDTFVRDHLETQWRPHNLDCLICPVFPIPAFPLDMITGHDAGATYTLLYNVLNFPCGTVPVGQVEKRDTDVLRSEYPKRYACEKNVHKLNENSEGLPIGVQCVALPFQEEVCFRLMREVELGLGKH